MGINIGEEIVENRQINMVDFEDYENWLEAKELEGWNLKSIDLNNDHTFVKGEPRKIRYCLDYRENDAKEYAQMFKDFGWELVYMNYTDFVWAKEFKNERPEAFDTLEVLKERNEKYKKDITIRTGGIITSLIFFVYLYGKRVGVTLTIIGFVLSIIIQVLCNWKNYKFLSVYNKNKRLIEEMDK